MRPAAELTDQQLLEALSEPALRGGLSDGEQSFVEQAVDLTIKTHGSYQLRSRRSWAEEIYERLRSVAGLQPEVPSRDVKPANVPQSDPFPHLGTVEEVRALTERVDRLFHEVMERDRDYAIFEGSEKPRLLKPGAERICMLLRARQVYTVEDVQWQSPEGVIHGYRVVCDLKRGGEVVATGVGACNAGEELYRGQGSHYDLDNTIYKVACKRALVAAATAATAWAFEDPDEAGAELAHVVGLVTSTVGKLTPGMPQETARLVEGSLERAIAMQDVRSLLAVRDFSVLLDAWPEEGTP